MSKKYPFIDEYQSDLKNSYVFNIRSVLQRDDRQQGGWIGGWVNGWVEGLMDG